MIIDTSALVAILTAEPEAARFTAAVADAPVRRISAATYVEACLVLGPRGFRLDLDEYIARIAIEIVPVTVQQARAAADASARFGKGHHPARLNLGDCFSYALAKTSDEPLLFKGDDFTQTDISAA